MPWKECSAIDERLQFVARWLAGESMAELCREFGISRKTHRVFQTRETHGQCLRGIVQRNLSSRMPGRSLVHIVDRDPSDRGGLAPGIQRESA